MKNDPLPRLSIGSVELATHLLETMKALPCADRFSIVDMHKEFPPYPLPEQELHFIMKCIVSWVCEVAEQGTIMIDELVIMDDTLMVKLQLHSRKFLPDLPERMEKQEDLCLRQAIDILQKFDGGLWTKLFADRLEVSFRMELSAL